MVPPLNSSLVLPGQTINAPKLAVSICMCNKATLALVQSLPNFASLTVIMSIPPVSLPTLAC